MYKILQEAEAYSEYVGEEYPFDELKEEAESQLINSSIFSKTLL